ncbi:MAG TPA: hypothetical protein VHT75_17185 [Acidimicrobiales bacterium]|nr:hypothetical protein [Acidimicrobiales bacterium]
MGASTTVAALGAATVRRWQRTNTRLFDLEVDAETAAIRQRVEEAAARSHRHALANALTAVEGASVLLERGTLSPPDRESLRRVLTSGVDRLRQLLDESPRTEVVALADVAARAADDPRWSGRVRLAVPPDLAATGSTGESIEAARQLLAYATRRAPGGGITMRAVRSGGWSVLWIDDRGPGLPARRRRVVIDSEGGRSKATDDLPLHVASRLVRGAGGELRIEKRPGGGCSFGLCLPWLPDLGPDEGDGVHRTRLHSVDTLEAG